MGNIANQGLSNWLFGEGNEQAEFEAAAELEKCGVRVIKDGGAGVTSIDFSNCLKPTDDNMRQVAKLRRLSTATFLRADINDDQLACLENMNHLSNLLINATPISDAGMAHLAALPALQTLYASNTKITDKGTADIAKIPTLTILNLSNTGITDQGIKRLSHLPNLNWLLILQTKVTDEGLAELASLPQLKRLSLSNDMKVTDQAVQKLKKTFPKLQVDFNKPEPAPETPPADAASRRRRINECPKQ